MKWTDSGILIKQRPFSEKSACLTFLTKENGVQTGLGSVSKRNPLPSLGDHVHLEWKARLSEHLGRFTCEINYSFWPHIIDCSWKLWMLQYCLELLNFLPEKHPYARLYNDAKVLFMRLCLADDHAYDSFVALTEFERVMLAEIGFGLHLEMCCVSGVRSSLTYISPKTGRAVCKNEGYAYHDKLLPYPIIWGAMEHDLLISDENCWLSIQEALYVTAYFLNRYLNNQDAHHNRTDSNKKKLPHSRQFLVDYCLKQQRLTTDT